MATVENPISAGAVASEASGLLKKFLGGPLEEAGEVLRDRIRVFRLEQQVKYSDEPQRIWKRMASRRKP